MAKTEIEEQLTRYKRAVELELKKDSEQAALPIEGICLVGKLPRGWEDAKERQIDEDSLRPRRIRVVTYSELINHAESAYSKFLTTTRSTEKLNMLLDRIREYQPQSADAQVAGAPSKS